MESGGDALDQDWRARQQQAGAKVAERRESQGKAARKGMTKTNQTKRSSPCASVQALSSPPPQPNRPFVAIARSPLAGGPAETPAEVLLAMMQTLLEGDQPDLRDVVYIRSALLVGSNLYAPHAELLSGRFKGHSLDVSVLKRALKRA